MEDFVKSLNIEDQSRVKTLNVEDQSRVKYLNVEDQSRVKYLNIPAGDSFSFQLQTRFDDILNFIHDALGEPLVGRSETYVESEWNLCRVEPTYGDLVSRCWAYMGRE